MSPCITELRAYCERVLEEIEAVSKTIHLSRAGRGQKPASTAHQDLAFAAFIRRSTE